MRVDRPIYCVQINREIHKHLGIPVNLQFHRTFHRIMTLSTVRPLYAGHAQIVECFYEDDAFLHELSELASLGFFVSLSKYSNLIDFVDSRRRMYEWDKPAYPMYFASRLNSISSFPTHSQGDPSTTEILRGIYASLYRQASPRFENKLDLNERRMLESCADVIRRHVVNEEGAITGAFFRRSPLLRDNKLLDRTLSRVLPYQFTNIYCDVFAAVTPTGFPQLSFFEDEQSFPYLDFDLVMSIMTKLGMMEIVLDHTDSGTRRFLDLRTHRNFHEFVKAKDNLLYLLCDQPKRGGLLADRLELLTSLRTMRIKPFDGDENDPFVAAAELYRASEQLCRDSPAARGRSRTMTDAQSWKGKYLIMTATDSEDHALRTEFSTRGFTTPIIQNTERFSYVEYFRSGIGRIYHVRTSAGSGGASGAFIMGKNAIDLLKPEYVISVGVCFGLREDKQCIGDVVISEYVHDYERLRLSTTDFQDRGATREAGPVLLSRARASLAIWNGATVHIGTVVSGEKLVDNREFRDFLRRLTPTSIAGEMEAWGLSAVCHETSKQFIMVKGICDWGMNKTSSQQDLAAANACKFVFEALIVA
jgi:nucleoside phosphorylase